MTSATRFAKSPLLEEVAEPGTTTSVVLTETDSVPRIEILDLVTAVNFLARAPAPTLEDLRLKLNLRREKFGSTAGYSVARDVASELGRLAYATVGPLPKDQIAFEKKRDTPIRLTEAGRELAFLLARKDIAGAYDVILKRLFEVHPYVRRFIAAIVRGPFYAPVVTGAERHIAARYGEAKVLADDVARGAFDCPALLTKLEERLRRPLATEERHEIEKGIDSLVAAAAVSASARDDAYPDFQRKFLSRINEVVVPAVLRGEGLGFDFNTLRRLWAMAAEFQIGWATSGHPRHDAWLTFGTATIDLSADGSRIKTLLFDKGLTVMQEDFLDHLYDAYELMQGMGCGPYVSAWQLRATFCFERRCAPGVFNFLFREHYARSEKYEIHKDFSRDRPQHEEAVIAGSREIGIVRMLRK